MTHLSRVFEFASAFASYVHYLHREIAKKIQNSNALYKFYADLHHRHFEFNEGDSVMIQIQPERFPPGTIKKLYARSTGPYKILKKINPNA